MNSNISRGDIYSKLQYIRDKSSQKNDDLEQVASARGTFCNPNRHESSDILLRATFDQSHFLVTPESEAYEEYSRMERLKLIEEQQEQLLQQQQQMEQQQEQHTRATYFGSSADQATSPISINSGRLNFNSDPALNKNKPNTKADPMRGYQPIVKNLQNIALRNRNFVM